MSGVAAIPYPANAGRPVMASVRSAVLGGVITSVLAAADWHLTNQEVAVLSIVAGVVSVIAAKAFDAFARKGGGDSGLSGYERRRLERQDRELAHRDREIAALRLRLERRDKKNLP